MPKALVRPRPSAWSATPRDLKQRGVKDADRPIPADILPQAERRVRLGLVVGRAGSRQQPAMPSLEQLRAHIEELSQSYEKPADVMRWYLGDRDRAEVESRCHRKQRGRFRVGQGQGHRQGLAVRRTDGQPGFNPRLSSEGAAPQMGPGALLWQIPIMGTSSPVLGSSP